MHYTLQAPENINASIKLPSSKSISNRVLVISQLCNNQCQLENLSDCDDTKVMMRALKTPSEITDIRAAGTAMRFLTAYFASTNHKTIMTGTERMKQRPISVLVDALTTLGADIRYSENKGYPPLRIAGKKLGGGEISLPGNISSQYISALMMTAPYMEKGLKINITGDIISRTYINLTKELMNIFGIKVKQEDERTIIIPAGTYTPQDFTVESDWSGSSYWYEIVALSNDPNCRVVLPYLHQNSFQGDSEVQHLFEPLGVKTQFSEEGVVLTKSNHLCETYDKDLNNQPDLAQTIVVTCAMLNIPFTISGLQTLRIKETDRLKALQVELAKMGYKIKEKKGSILTWDGKKGNAEEHIAIDTYEDHRMAMAFAPCTLKMPKLDINNPEVVSKSYPNFWKDLQKAGFKITNI